MDLREIIKWFIPCFHILLAIFVKMDSKLTLVFLFLLFNTCPSFAAKVNNVRGEDLSVNSFDTKNVDLINVESRLGVNQSDLAAVKLAEDENKSMDDVAVGRTFGRPFKKMMSALLPLVFQIGAASTWAVVAALVGVKTLLVTLVILKLLLVAGAAKVGALFASKSHHKESHGWEPHHPQKEIHLHIHNGHGQITHEETHPPSVWNRNEVQLASNNYVLDPYSASGPQTISTPYGNYVKID